MECLTSRLKGWLNRSSVKPRLFRKWWEAVFLSLVFFSGCQVSPYIRPIHENDHLLVRLEDHTGGPFPENPTAFDHPVVLSEDQWGQILRAIQIQREPGGDPAYGEEETLQKGEGEMEALFTAEERHSLQPYLAQAFARARPSEWVTFVIRHPLGTYHWLNKTIQAHSISSGGMYVVNHMLHLYLTNIRAPLTSTVMEEQIWHNPFSVSDAAFYHVKKTKLQMVKRLSQHGLRGKINPSIYDVALDMRKILGQETKGKPRALEEQPRFLSSQEETSGMSQKLRELLKMKQEGLITQEDYDAMKKKILDQFVNESP